MKLQNSWKGRLLAILLSVAMIVTMMPSFVLIALQDAYATESSETESSSTESSATESSATDSAVTSNDDTSAEVNAEEPQKKESALLGTTKNEASVASVTIGEATEYYEDLHEALEAGKAAGSVVTLIADVSLNGNWTPVSDFKGTFDGDKHTITGLTVNTESKAAMFASMGSATVKDLVIDGAHVTATVYSSATYSYAAIICADAWTNTVFQNITIKNSTVSAIGEYVGSIVGAGYPQEISGCIIKDCNIKGPDQVGGLIGYTKSGDIVNNTIKKTTTITATDTRAGGIVGKLQSASGEGCNVNISNNKIVATLVTGNDGVTGGIAGQIMGDWDKYSIKGNTIDCADATNPIGSLRAGQNAAFTEVLSTNITGNSWTEDTYNKNSFTYTDVPSGVAEQTITNATPFGFYVDVDGVYHITNVAGLKEFRDFINANSEYTVGTIFQLDSDINLKGEEWTPINVTQNHDIVFDGNGHKIRNFKVNVDGHAGLFLSAATSTIKNLTIEKANVTGTNHVAAIAGYGICAKFENCKVYNSVVTTLVDSKADNGDKAGAICGYLSGELNAWVKNCTVDGCTIRGYRDIGGAVGIANGSAEVTGNTVTNTTVINDQGTNYNSYTTDEQFDVNKVVGETSAKATVNNNTAGDDVVVKIVNKKIIVDSETSKTAAVTEEDQTSAVAVDSDSTQATQDFANDETTSQRTSVSGVKLTDVPTVSNNTKTGLQAVVDAAVAKAASAIATVIKTAESVDIKVNVKVTPTQYVTPASETEGTVAFALKPEATVTVGEGSAAVSETVEVTNEMINQAQNIEVKLYTGFRPSLIVHVADDGTKTSYTEDIYATDSTFTYDSTDGVATFYVHHFSDVLVYQQTKVASITKADKTTTCYNTLAEALAAAESGDTVEVLEGEWGAEAIGTIDNTKVRYKSLTIKAADNANVVFTSDVALGYDQSNTSNAKMTVNNISFSNAALYICGYAQVDVDGCKFTGSGHFSDTYGALIIKDSCCTNHTTEGEYIADAVTVNNCTFNGTASGVQALQIRNSGNATITNNKISNSSHNGIGFQKNGDFNNSGAKTVTITGNTITEWNASNISDGGRAIRLAFGTLAEGSTVNVNNNYFTKVLSQSYDSPDYVKISDVGSATVNLDNNSWNDMVKSDVSGKTAIYTVDSVAPAVSSVISTKYVAQIGDVKYETLAAAIAAVPTDGTQTTITMIADETIPQGTDYGVKFPASTNIILDLNGKVISGANSSGKAYGLFDSNGTLTIQDSSEGKTGKISFSGNPTSIWYNTNTINVNAGKLTVKSGTLENADTNGGASYVINLSNNTNAAEVLIEGGTFTAPSCDAVIRMHDQMNRSGKIILTINDGTFTGGSGDAVIWLDVQGNAGEVNTSECEMYLNGGTFTAASGQRVLDFGSGSSSKMADSTGIRVELNGGKYFSNADTLMRVRSISDTNISNIEISGGYFNKTGIERKWVENPSVTTLSGLVAEGKAVTSNTDETTKTDYPYTIGDAVASITSGDATTYYASLQEAVNAATEGCTVTLLSDVTLTSRVDADVNATYTIDLNGKTISSTATCGNGSAFNITAGTVTIKNGTIDGTAVTQTSEQAKSADNECDAITVRSGATVNLVSGLTVKVNSITGSCVYAFAGGQVNITGGYYENAATTAYPYKTDFKALVVNQANYDKGATTSLFNITGGTFKGQDPEAGDDSWAAGTDLSFLANGYVSSFETSEGVYIVSRAVAQISNKKYASLAAAIAAVPTDGTQTTITMIADEELTTNPGVEVAAKQNVVLDLNGYTIKSISRLAATSFAIKNCGILTIKDSTDTQKNGTGTGAIIGNALKPDETEIPGYASNTIVNYGHLTVESGFIESKGTGTASFAIDNEAEGAQWQNTCDKVVSLTITGGKFRSNTSNTIRMYMDTQGLYTNNISISNADMGSLWLQDNWNSTDGCKAEGSLTVKNTTFTKSISLGYYRVINNLTVDIQDSVLTSFYDDLNYYSSEAYHYKTLVFKNNKVQYYFKSNKAESDRVIDSGYFNNLYYEDSNGYRWYLSECIADGYTIINNPDYDSTVTDCTDIKSYKYTIAKAPHNLTFEYTYNEKTYERSYWYQTIAEAVSDAQWYSENWSTYDARNFKVVLGENTTLTSDLEVSDAITLDLNGHEIAAGTNSIKVENGDLNITGEGNITGDPSKYKLIYLVGSTDSTAKNYSNVTIGENVKVECTNGYAIMLSAKNNAGFGVNITVNGTVEGYYGALYINGTVSPTTGNVPVITLGSTGKLIADVGSAAIFAAGYGTWNLAGGITGGSAIYAKTGVINITGGTLTATGAQKDYSYQPSGYEITGDTIVVDNCNYPGGVPTVNISGGTFTSTNALLQVGAYYGNGMEAVANIYSTDNTLTAPEGYFWCTTTTAGTYKLAKPEASITSDETTTNYASLADAVSAATAGDTIKLLADVTVTSTVLTDKNITINLNGYDITGSGVRAIQVKSETLELTGKGTVTASDITNASQSIIRVGQNDNIEASLIVGENVTVSTTECSGITVFNGKSGTTPDKNVKLVLNGKVTSTDVPAIAGCGNSYNGTTNITIASTASVTTTNENAIYFPCDGILTIDGTVTGKGGIETKAGTANVTVGTSATITATATTTTHKVNNDGCSTSGYAIAVVDNAGYKGNASVNIAGGLIKGTIAIVDDDEDTTNNHGKIAISGGIFSVSPDSAYLATGKSVITNTDSETKAIYPFTIGVKTGDVTIKTKDEGTTTETIKVDVDTTVDYSVHVEEAKVTIPQEVKEAISNSTVVSGVELEPDITEELGNVNGVQAVVNAAKEQAVTDNNTAFTNAVAASTTTNTTVTIKVDVQVTPTGYNTTSTSGSANNTITFDLTPVATVTIQNGSNTAVTQTTVVTNDMIDQDKDIEVKLYTGFEPKSLIHRDDDGTTIIDTYTKADTASYENKTFSYDEATGVCTVYVRHFSDFVAVSNAESYVAKIGETEYSTLQAAVTAVQDGETIVITANNTETLTVSGAKTFYIIGGSFNAPTVSEAGYTVTVDGTKVTVSESTYTVTTTSRISGTETTVATVSGGGKIGVVSGTTLSAPSVDGYTFEGWYTDYTTSSYGTLVSKSATVNYIPTADVTVYAVYTLNSTSTFTLDVTGSYFNVNEKTQEDHYKKKISGGTVTVSYTDSNKKFLYWVNGSGALVSTNASYTFTMVADTELKAVAANSSNSALAKVIFRNSFNVGAQELQVDTYEYDGTGILDITYPAAPSSYGRTFQYWALNKLDEDGQYIEATAANITAAIAEGDTYVMVAPVYESDGTYKVTMNCVNDAGEDVADPQSFTVNSGKTYTLTAPTIDGKTFSHWKNASGTTIGTNSTYTVLSNSDITIKAVYGEAVDPISTILMVASKGMNGEKYRMTFSAIFSIDSTKTIAKRGFLYSTTSTTLIYDNKDNLSIYEWDDTTSNTGVMIRHLNTSNPDLVVNIRPYVITTSGDIIYGDMQTASYNTIAN